MLHIWSHMPARVSTVGVALAFADQPKSQATEVWILIDN